MPTRTIKEMDLSGKRVLARVDFNVPWQDGRIADDTRIQRALETIRYILTAGGRLVLMSHLGRPQGKPDPAFSLKPVADHLAQLLGQEVHFAADCVGPEAEKVVGRLKGGDVCLLENVRFHPGETSKSEPELDAFSRRLAALGDVYVNDAFGAAHRAHGSVVGVTKHLSPCGAGFLMQKEIEAFARVLEDPARPLVAVLGGAKVSDKIHVIGNLLGKVDVLLIGGAMAYTFQKALGGSIGESLVENDKLDLAGTLLQEANDKSVDLILPEDTVIADRFAADAQTQIVAAGRIPDGWQGMDIGPATRERFVEFLKTAKTVVWNGPMGVFEMAPFAAGTLTVGRAIADGGALSVVGGGDSVAAVNQLGLADKISHISTGGGASLELLEGKILPGLAALDEI